jgi:RNA polymerase sigma-70 factor (ECF subfamily)
MNPCEEAGEWGRAAAGDGDAFGRLFDAHSGRVYRHALRLTGDTHNAEDVLAAAFLELWRRRQDVRVVDGSVLPWLLVTAGNLALNQGRGLRRHRAFLARLPRQELRVGPAEVQALLRADLDVDPALLAAIKALSTSDQQLLALVALEDYPLRAAAEALGLTEHAARSRWQRIRRRLAQNRTPDSLVLDSLALAVEH